MQPPFDRDFPSLAGRSNVGKSWHSGNALPEQQWTRLADAPDGSALSPRVLNPRMAESPLAEPAKALPKQGSGPLDAPAASHSRMVDTLQQVDSQRLSLSFVIYTPVHVSTQYLWHVSCSTCIHFSTYFFCKAHPCKLLLLVNPNQIQCFGIEARSLHHLAPCVSGIDRTCDALLFFNFLGYLNASLLCKEAMPCSWHARNALQNTSLYQLSGHLLPSQHGCISF